MCTDSCIPIHCERGSALAHSGWLAGKWRCVPVGLAGPLGPIAARLPWTVRFVRQGDLCEKKV